MRGGAVDVVLQQVHVLENGVVHPLEHVIVRSVGDYEQGIIDEAVTQGPDIQHLAFYGEMAGYISELFCGFHIPKLKLYSLFFKKSDEVTGISQLT